MRTTPRSEVTSPCDLVRLGMITRTGGCVDQQVHRRPGSGSDLTRQAADHRLRFRPGDLAHPAVSRPSLLVQGAELVQGADNRAKRPGEAQERGDALREPRRLRAMEGRGGAAWMVDDHPASGRVVHLIEGFLTEVCGTSPTGGDRP
jgi:hypothetical protein